MQCECGQTCSESSDVCLENEFSVIPAYCSMLSNGLVRFPFAVAANLWDFFVCLFKSNGKSCRFSVFLINLLECVGFCVYLLSQILMFLTSLLGHTYKMLQL